MANDITPNAVTHVTDWKFQNSYVERLMDHAALTSAHPDDTLILAGPPRWLSSGVVSADDLLPVGMVQTLSINQQKPTTPAMAIGTGRQYYLSGKAQGSAQIQRLFVNGRNLNRVLMTNAMRSGVDVSKFDDIAATKKNAKAFFNLDSELFLIPFGLGVIFRDKLHNDIGAIYLELCMISSWSINIVAGQSVIAENVALLFDRCQPIDSSMLGEAPGSVDNHDPASPESSKVYTTVYNGATGVVDTPNIDTK